MTRFIIERVLKEALKETLELTAIFVAMAIVLGGLIALGWVIPQLMFKYAIARWIIGPLCLIHLIWTLNGAIRKKIRKAKEEYYANNEDRPR